MKNLFIILLIFLSQNVFSNIDTLNVKSEIIDVTVFLKGAQVIREAKLDLSQGKQYLRFDNLPYKINPESIQVEGMKDCIILSVNHKQHSLHNKSDEEIIIHGEIDKLLLENEQIENEISVFILEEKLLMDNRILSKNSESGTRIKEIKEAADFYRIRLNEIKKAKLKLKTELKSRKKKLIKLYAQLNKYAIEGEKIFSQVIVAIECKKQTLSKIKLKYFISSAGWIPNYDYRVDDINKPLTLVYNAKVFQSTEENWDKINLTLSTNNPSLNGNKPELVSWYIEQGFPDYRTIESNNTCGVSGVIYESESNVPLDFASVKIYKNSKLIASTQTDLDGRYFIKSLESGIYDIEASYIGYKTQRKTRISVRQGQITYIDFNLSSGDIKLNAIVVSELGYATKSINKISSDEFSKIKVKRKKIKHFIPTTTKKIITNLEYKINIPYSIPSDGIAYNIKMQETSIPVEYIYHVVPKLNNDAFLVANIPDWSELNLLSGKSFIYYQGTFVGESYIDVNKTDDTLSISLGKDSNIIIKRKLDKGSKGKIFLSKKIKEIVGWNITLKNNKDVDVRILVKDQYPISNQKSIDIDLLEFSEAKVNDKTGILTWELTLKPSEKKDIGFKYSVKYPKHLNLRTEL